MLLERLERRVVLAATPVISEFLSSNSSGLQDEDGDSSDWIEIYNPTTDAVDLSGWTLTDDVNDINQWVFPAVTIQPDEFVVVFASGKDRDLSGSELHTNFQLTSGGEFLGFYQPNGEVASLFSPQYPDQATNISYGINFRTEQLVEAGDISTYFAPTDGSLEASWQTPDFDDSGWSTGATGLGYGIIQPGFEITYYKAQASGEFNGSVSSLTIAKDVISNADFQSQVVSATADVVNFQGSGGGGRYGGNQPFPTQTIGVDINDFVVQAETSIDVPAAGFYSFGVNSDDGFGLTITNGSDVFTSEFPGTRGSSDTIATFMIPQAGSYDVEVVMFERGGGSSLEFFAAPGMHDTFDAAVFDLVGDVANGGLAASVEYAPGSNPVVQTDLSADMQGLNANLYVRIPFSLSEVSTLDALELKMRYDDGFVAAINGVEVARRNAPETLSYDSQATAARSPEDVLTEETIVLSQAALDALVEGTNVLTIRGLNSSSADPSFLTLPELSASGLLVDQYRFFTTPSPGEPNLNPADGIVGRVTSDVPAGFFTGAFNVTLTADAGSQIRYTTDGSEPSADNGMDYEGPINITGSTNLRAIAVRPDYASLPSRTWTYLFLEDVLTQSNDGTAPAGWPETWKNNVVDYGIDPEVIDLEGAQAVKDALQAIPTWSITTDIDNLFDPGIGIYSNPQQDGRDWERPASVELIDPDGGDGFQVNAGVRIRGGFSRSTNNPKHSFRLFFRSTYGDAELDYPVHGEAGTDKFKKIDLRTAQNYSWSFQGNASNNFVVDVLARYNQRDLGQPYTRSSWLHLYLNGQYWGLYQTQERAEANFAETYLGGDADDYDVLKPERGPYANIATDGEFGAYDRLFQQAAARADDGVTPAFVDYAKYMEAQGLNPDGTRNEDYEVLLDVDNLIAYMIVIFQGGNLDAPISNFLGNNRINNHFSIRDRTGDEGFRFFIHDSEHTLRNVNQDRTGPYNHANFESSVNYFNPQWLHQQLMANDEYLIRFADKLQQAFFNGGPLTTEAQLAKLNAEAALLDSAIIGESARWGDAKATNVRVRENWVNAINGLRNNYFPNRNAVLISQFQNTKLVLKDAEGNYTVEVPAPLLPSIDAPGYRINNESQSGGQVASGSELRMIAAAGTVYYTTDGSDPRLLGGGISPNAVMYDATSESQTWIGEGSNWKYFDGGVDLGTQWRGTSFDDAAWASGDAQLGYGDGDEVTVLSFGPSANAKFRTTYFRKSFSADADAYTTSKLRLRRDDGAVVYLNGVEIARSNLPSGTISYGTAALSAASDDGNSWLEFDFDPTLLVDGENTLAVEIHQVSNTSSDISFDAELITSRQTSEPLVLESTTPINGRAYDSTTQTWSALHAAGFVIPQEPASIDNLRITEIHYNPAGSDDPEFIELANITTGDDAVTIDLGSVTLTDGPSDPLVLDPTATLAPGEHGVLVADRAAFLTAYPGFDQGLILGEFMGSLNNGGERIRMVDAVGVELFDFEYEDSDPWSIWADNNGGSLVLRDAALTPADELGKHYHWRGSTQPGGSPGAADPTPLGVVVNEVLAHTDAPAVDTIELHNTTGEDINIGGWYLSDDVDALLKFAIPGGTVIPAGGFLTFDESDFNPTPLTPGPNDFALSGSHGDSIWLVEANGAGDSVIALSDHVSFGATYNGVTLGRKPGGSGRLVPLASPSLGAANGSHAVADVVVTEVQYHPDSPSDAALALEPLIKENDLEFVEIHNRSESSVDLTNWRLRGEGDFDFAAGQMMTAGEVLVVVSFDPAQAPNANLVDAFRAHYGINETVTLIGPFTSTLDNSFGIVKLQAPDEAPVDEPTVLPRVLVDELLYDDLEPWPEAADGSGMSLQRAHDEALGNDSESWRAADPTPGTTRFVPGVESVVINQGDATRSEVTTISVVFDSLIEPPDPSAFALTNTTTGQTVTGLSVSSADVGGKTVSILSFTSGPSVILREAAGNTLDDGDYQLSILSSGIAAKTGAAPMDGDVVFGDQAIDSLYRRYGDQDGDGTVGLLDFAVFRSTFGLAVGDENYRSDFDNDGDKTVTLLEFADFRSNFGS